MTFTEDEWSLLEHGITEAYDTDPEICEALTQHDLDSAIACSVERTKLILRFAMRGCDIVKRTKDQWLQTVADHIEQKCRESFDLCVRIPR